jgi:hypothetical protein
MPFFGVTPSQVYAPIFLSPPWALARFDQLPTSGGGEVPFGGRMGRSTPRIRPKISISWSKTLPKFPKFRAAGPQISTRRRACEPWCRLLCCCTTTTRVPPQHCTGTTPYNKSFPTEVLAAAAAAAAAASAAVRWCHMASSGGGGAQPATLQR